MDPNANLKEQLEIVGWLGGGWADSGPWEAQEFAEARDEKVTRLGVLVLELHEHLSKGGFLPWPWQAKPRCPIGWVPGALHPPGSTKPKERARCSLPVGHEAQGQKEHVWGPWEWSDRAIRTEGAGEDLLTAVRRIWGKLSEIEKQAQDEGVDSRRKIVSVALGIPIEQVTTEQRNAIKLMLFGRVYGMSGERLRRALRSEDGEDRVVGGSGQKGGKGRE